MSSQRTLTCQELTEVLTDGCGTYVDQMRQTIRTVRALRPEDVEATAPDDLLAAFLAWKRGDALPGT
jgi:hypothetical protein